MTHRLLALIPALLLAACATPPPDTAYTGPTPTIPASAAAPSEGWDAAALAAQAPTPPSSTRAESLGSLAAPTAGAPAAAWVKPVAGMTCRPAGGSGYFGAPRPGHIHAGVDLNSRAHVYRGSAIRAIHAGIAHWGYQASGAGIYVWVSHGDGSSAWFFHMARRAVANGAHVNAGTVIGYVGATGNAAAKYHNGIPQYHLHFEIKVPKGTTRYGRQLSGGQVDPVRFLAAHGIRIGC